MPDGLQQHLAELAEGDSERVAEAARALRRAVDYQAEAAQGVPPGREVIDQANDMRVVELGEAYKNLINAGLLKKDTVIFESGDTKITAGKLTYYRDILAHPERGMPRADYGSVYAHREAIAQQLQDMQAAHPGNSDISAGLDAVEHLSGDKNIAPTVWRDAENYKEVESVAVKGGVKVSHCGGGKGTTAFLIRMLFPDFGGGWSALRRR